MAEANAYDVGDVARVTGTWTDVDTGAVLDPDSVVLKIKKPDKTEQTFTYGTDAAVVRLSEGIYRAEVLLDQAGTWYYRWESSGTGAAAQQGRMFARGSAF